MEISGSFATIIPTIWVRLSFRKRCFLRGVDVERDWVDGAGFFFYGEGIYDVLDLDEFGFF